MARSNLNMMLMSADDKPLMLHKLQGRIHFEKTLTAATSSLNEKSSAGLSLPTWFVRKHGDKFRKSTILRTESSTEPWPVNLTVWFYSPTRTQVRFSGGWQAFTISNGLLEGDLLIFELKAMSEFKVYVFRSIEGPNKNPSPNQRKRTYDSSHSQKKARQPYRKCRDEHMGADDEGSDESTNGLNKKASAVYDSAITPIPPSCKEDSLHHLPSFGKTLTATNVRGHGRQAYLEFPAGFCRKYGNRIHTVVKLQGIHEQSPERTMACRTSFGKDIRHCLRAEWRAFVTENHLHVGQLLLVTLFADSFFVVRDQSACNWAHPKITQKSSSC